MGYQQRANAKGGGDGVGMDAVVGGMGALAWL